MANSPSTPVFFSIPGLTGGDAAPDNAPLEAPAENTQTMEAYKIPPVVWIIVFLVGGYMLVRYALEES